MRMGFVDCLASSQALELVQKLTNNHFGATFCRKLVHNQCKTNIFFLPQHDMKWQAHPIPSLAVLTAAAEPLAPPVAPPLAQKPNQVR
eukprot:1604784-Amphidinium_carterae.1